MDVTLEKKIRALRSGAAYESTGEPIEAIETHFAWVFLSASHAYKMKKPLRWHGLDFTTLAARKHSCEEEVRLNRRLAPSVYLGAVPLVCREDGTLHVGGAGHIVDWLVVMRRLPSHLMLDHAIAAGTAATLPVESVGELLADFYERQPPIDFSPSAYVHRMTAAIELDLAELSAPDLNLPRRFVGSVADEAQEACGRVRADLESRAQERRIVEGHGDVRPEHVCLSDPPCIIDALEFSLDLRTIDPGEELAYLSIECERLGDISPAERVLDRYLQVSRDPIPERLIDFYRCRRAMVRAKLVAWRLRDPALREDPSWGERVQAYLTKAHEYAGRVLG